MQTTEIACAPRWGVSLAIAAMLLPLALIGCGQPAGAAPHTKTLSWQQGTIPPAIASQFALTVWHELPLAPSDGNTLYGCALAPQAGATPAVLASPAPVTPQVWVTHDRALHWILAGTLPITRPDISLCYLTVDQLDPATVLAVVAWPQAGNHPTPGQSASFITLTGGQTWQPFAYTWAPQIVRLATTSGTTYALVDSNDPAAPHLVASTDGLQTWHSIDLAISATGQKVWGFVVTPGTSTILAQVGKDGVPVRQLWRTQNGGATWVAEPVPTVEQYAFGAAAAATPRPVCAAHYDGYQPAHAANYLYCSADGGAQWSARPALNLRASGAVFPAIAGDVDRSQIVAVTPDGAILALHSGTPTPQFYRLPAGGTAWQSVGGLPLALRMVVFYEQPAGSGVLWAFSVTTDPATPSAKVFTAAYP